MNILTKIRHYFSHGYCFITLGKSFEEVKDNITPCATELKLIADSCTNVIKKHNGNS